jgi:hypothetical protein
MKRPAWWLLGVCLFSLSSCPPKRVQRPVDEFFDSMDWLWQSMSPRNPDTAAERTLVQLGLPTDTSLTLWHLCPRGARDCTVEATTQSDGGVIAEERVAFEGAHRVELHGLAPATSYDVRVQTSWSSGAESHTRVDTLRATTRPSATDSNRFSFVVGSCNETLHVNDKMADRRPGLHSAHINSLNLLRLRATAKLLIEQLPQQPSFYVGLGDQVYMDAEWDHDDKHRGFALFRGVRSDEWAFATGGDRLALNDLAGELSRRSFALPPLDSAFRDLPSVLVWDDHEIRDGFRNQRDETTGNWPEWYRAARLAYVRDQLLRRPGLDPHALVADAGLHLPTHASFSWGSSAHFFILEGRSAENVDGGTGAAQLFGAQQWDAFKSWFAARSAADAPPAVLVVGLPGPLTTQFGAFAKSQGRGDDKEERDDLEDQLGASGADVELARLLVTIDPTRHRLLIVSGDVHSNSATRLSYAGRELGVEIVSSGLAAFREGTTLGFEKDVASGALEKPTPIVWDGGRLDVEGLGTLRQTTSFAEVVIEPQAEGPPALRIFFFPSVGNPASALFAGIAPESYRLSNPVAYLEHHQDRVWPSRPYDGKAVDAPRVGYLLVGKKETSELEGRACKQKEGVNCLHATASVCIDYRRDLRAEPYGATNWWGELASEDSCSVLKDECNLDQRLNGGGECPQPQVPGDEVQSQPQ